MHLDDVHQRIRRQIALLYQAAASKINVRLPVSLPPEILSKILEFHGEYLRGDELPVKSPGFDSYRPWFNILKVYVVEFEYYLHIYIPTSPGVGLGARRP